VMRDAPVSVSLPQLNMHRTRLCVALRVCVYVCVSGWMCVYVACVSHAIFLYMYPHPYSYVPVCLVYARALCKL